MMTDPSGHADDRAEIVEELATERRPAPTVGPAPLGLDRERLRIAWWVALGADFLQIVAMPIFGLGAISPFNDVLDVVVCLVLIKLLGWHWAFLPTLVAEMIPGLDLVPTWTAAVFIAGRRRR